MPSNLLSGIIVGIAGATGLMAVYCSTRNKDERIASAVVCLGSTAVTLSFVLHTPPIAQVDYAWALAMPAIWIMDDSRQSSLLLLSLALLTPVALRHKLY